ncbi:Uncharacterised protein [Cedecea neteri]|uniref:Invasin n=1 Tax=Cedecea neteri TaxID=158822 RepID=A0A2X2T683_9ENTR|nr:Uncharacterised protein [Cedecea neteri]
MKLGGWDKPAESGAYAITATTPDQAKSAIKTDNTTYASGADMLITVTLKDANGKRCDRRGGFADDGSGHGGERDP